MASAEEEGIRPFIARHGPPMARHDFIKLSHRLEGFRVGAPATDDRYMSSRQSFDYCPTPGPDYIRLLYLHPMADDPAELRGSLKFHKLSEPVVYEAISYSWGEFPKFNQVILLDGKVLKITDNLYAALMAFSRPHSVRVLWADAICINQTDTTEKAQQVALMAEIYSRAKLVQVWLTLHSDAATGAIEYLRDLSSKADAFGISQDVGHPRRVETWPNVDIARSDADKMINDAIKHNVDFLLYRSWFNRVWVVQEVALAADLVVSCGHSTLTWTELARALEVLRGVYRRMSNRKDRLHMEGLKPAWGLVKHRDEWRFLNTHVDQNHHVATNIVGEQMMNKGCTDDRDRVYAMLSMTKSPYAGMVPDYTKTVAEAYIEFTRRYSPNTQIYWAGLARRQILTKKEASQTLDDTAFATEYSEQSLDITDRDYLPSWVPEFRPARNLAWAAPFTGSYATARAAPFFFFSHPKIEKVMFASGSVIDTIEYMNCTLKMGPPYYFQHPAFFFSLMAHLTHLLDNPPATASHTTHNPFPIQLAKALTSGMGDCPHAAEIFQRYTFIEELATLTTTREKGHGDKEEETGEESTRGWEERGKAQRMGRRVGNGVEVNRGEQATRQSSRQTEGMKKEESKEEVERDNDSEGETPPAPGSLRWLATIWTAFTTHCLSPTGSLYQRILLFAITDNRTHLIISAADGATLSPTEKLAFAFLNYIANILISNRLFVTHGGRIGLAPGIARPGDGLAVINGCHMPYVMRKVRQASYDGETVEPAMQVVGPCYLHGIMRGEIFGRVYGEVIGGRWDGLGWTRYPGDKADSLEGWLALV